MKPSVISTLKFWRMNGDTVSIILFDSLTATAGILVMIYFESGVNGIFFESEVDGFL